MSGWIQVTMQQNTTYSNSFFCAMHSTYLQYYVLSKQYLTALTYYYDFNVYIKYVEKKYVYELWSCIRAVEGFLKVLTFTIGAERKLYA